MESNFYNLLFKLLGSRTIVQIKREVCDHFETGFVSALNQEFIVLNRLTDDFIIDGFSIFSVSTISSFKILKKSDVMSKAVDYFGFTPAQTKEINLASWASIISSCAKEWEIINCSFERKYPDECYIGTVIYMGSKTFKMRLITPKGKALNELTSYSISELTKLEIGKRYENVLRSMVNFSPINLN